LSRQRKLAGSYEFTTAQLKTIQEGIARTVFSVFSVAEEAAAMELLSGFAVMIGAVVVIFKKWWPRPRDRSSACFVRRLQLS